MDEEDELSLLPKVDDVFQRFFDRWYDEDDRERKGFSHTRPDLMRCYDLHLTSEEISPLHPDTQSEVAARIQTMWNSARGDWPEYLKVTNDPDPHWIQAFDEHYHIKRTTAVIERSDPEDYTNDLLVLVCQLGAVLGETFRQLQPRLLWIPEWPYWESSLYDPMSGKEVPPFHWAIKKFSSYGVSDGLIPKMLCCIQLLDKETE